MNAIGGYFELELRKTRYYPHKNAIHLKSARNALKLILQNHNIKEIYVPYFTCKVVLDTIKELGCRIRFYHIKEDFSPRIKVSNKNWILYTNYFGINLRNVKNILLKYTNVIIDNAQSFFAPPSKICFYSPRKFVGVSDGGILYDEKYNRNSLSFKKDISFERAKFLFKRLDLNPESSYSDFKQSEDSLSSNIELISNLTKSLLFSIDYNFVKKIRIKNFNTLKKLLPNTYSLNSFDIPMVYPYFANLKLREHLIKNRVFIPIYWPYMQEWCKKNSFEIYLQNHLLALPIDQRYGTKEMKYITNLILEAQNGGGGGSHC